MIRGSVMVVNSKSSCKSIYKKKNLLSNSFAFSPQKSQTKSALFFIKLCKMHLMHPFRLTQTHLIAFQIQKLRRMNVVAAAVTEEL